MEIFQKCNQIICLLVCFATLNGAEAEKFNPGGIDAVDQAWTEAVNKKDIERLHSLILWVDINKKLVPSTEIQELQRLHAVQAQSEGEYPITGASWCERELFYLKKLERRDTMFALWRQIFWPTFGILSAELVHFYLCHGADPDYLFNKKRRCYTGLSRSGWYENCSLDHKRLLVLYGYTLPTDESEYFHVTNLKLNNITQRIIKSEDVHDRDLARLTGNDRDEALCYAVGRGNVEMIEKLIRLGANPDASLQGPFFKDSRVTALTILHTIMTRNNKKEVIERKASYEKMLQALGCYVIQRDEYGIPLPHWTAKPARRFWLLMRLFNKNSPIVLDEHLVYTIFSHEHPEYTQVIKDCIVEEAHKIAMMLHTPPVIHCVPKETKQCSCALM